MLGNGEEGGFEWVQRGVRIQRTKDLFRVIFRQTKDEDLTNCITCKFDFDEE
jgi:hypothetical protein